MDHSELVEKYLTRVILFKEKQTLYSDFCDETKREKLLKELSEDVGFDTDVWEYRKECAERAFRIYEVLDDDYAIGRVVSEAYTTLLEKYIRRAIALDPYNESYLKEYFRGPVGRSRPDKKLAIQWISLFHPNSSEFQNLLVDLKLKSNEVVFDYLSESVTRQFITEMVLLRQKSEVIPVDEKYSQKLQSLALDAGIDSKTLRTIEEDVKQMVRTVQDALNSSWLNWSMAHKAVLAMERATDMAPYDKDVLLTGITFYGGFYWRLLLGYKEIKLNTDRAELMEHVFGEKKPKREIIYRKSVELFRKSLELKERLFAVLLKESNETDKKNKPFGIDASLTQRIDFGLRYNRLLRFDKTNKLNIDAYLDKETLTFKLLSEHYKAKKHDLTIILVSGILTAILCAFFSRWVFGSWFPFFPFFIPALLVPSAILYVREKMRQRQKTDPDEILDLDSLRY